MNVDKFIMALGNGVCVAAIIVIAVCVAVKYITRWKL